MKVICLGSPFGDDAVGLAAAPLIAARLALTPVLALDRPGATLALHLAGSEDVVLVDAVKSGAPAGYLHRLDGEALLSAARGGLSTHAFGVNDACALARALGMQGRIVLWGVEGERARGGLSPAVAGALPALVEAVCREVEEGRWGPSGGKLETSF